jgi:alanyl-tRNA synthetase
LKALRSRLAAGRAAEIAAAAVDGVVVDRVDVETPGDLRELALAVRQQGSLRRVVLVGATASGGVALVSAVGPDAGVEAAALIRDAAKAVGGGGGGKGDVATAGGKDPSGIDEALKLAREAATA